MTQGKWLVAIRAFETALTHMRSKDSSGEHPGMGLEAAHGGGVVARDFWKNREAGKYEN